jgi:hypothetical protein
LGSFQEGCEFSCVLTHGQQIHRSDPEQEPSAVQTFLLKHYFSTLTSMLRKPFPGPQAPDLQWRSERLKTIGSIARVFSDLQMGGVSGLYSLLHRTEFEIIRPCS